MVVQQQHKKVKGKGQHLL